MMVLFSTNNLIFPLNADSIGVEKYFSPHVSWPFLTYFTKYEI